MYEQSARGQEYQDKLLAFMDEHIYPAEAVYAAQMAESGDPHFHPPVIEELKTEAKKRGLWNLFHPHPEWGPGLTNLEYAPLAEIMGRSAGLAPEATNCNAPDTGNMEVLTLFGTEEHKEKWLKPLLNGEIASAFAMTEPAVASSTPATSRCGWSATATTTCSTAASGGPPTPCTPTARSSSSWVRRTPTGPPSASSR